MSNNKNHKKIDFKYNFKTYLGFLKNYKWWAFLIIIFAALFELKSLFEKYLFKILVDSGAAFISKSITNSKFTSILIIVGIVYLIAIIIAVFSNWLKNHFVNKMESAMIADLKRRYFNHIITLDHNFHVTHKTGSLISRIKRGGSAMERMSDTIVYNFASLIIQVLAVFVSLIYFDFITGVVVFLTVLAFIIFSFIIQKMQQESNLIANTTEDIEKGNTSDIFTNIDSIKYFGKEKQIKEKYYNLTEKTKNAFLKNWNYFRYLSAGQTFILGLGTIFIVYLSINNFIKGNITLGTLAFIYTAFLGLISEMYGFVNGLRGFYSSMADFQDLFEYGKIKKEILDKPNAKELKIKEGEIEFNNITFKYGKRTIFKDFSLKVPKNKKIALVGHSGSGKTTLVKLLYRFYDLDKGEILIDNININDIKQESLREEMSIVPQEAVLFDDTIYNNIAFSSPKATKEEVNKAIKFAQLDKIIENFTKKENTVVGERGVRLSGGEKQRVSIARAILANKKILVLDEATSSLDSITEAEIQAALHKLMQGRTSIIIAHRLSTIMNADKIIVMKNGKIMQMGTHKQLINQPGEYKHLWNIQKGGYIK